MRFYHFNGLVVLLMSVVILNLWLYSDLVVVISWQYIFFVSVFSIALLAFDKHQSINSGRRVAESHLLFLMAVGGWIPVAISQFIMRHKTSKKTFAFKVYLVGTLQIIAAIMC